MMCCILILRLFYLSPVANCCMCLFSSLEKTLPQQPNGAPWLLESAVHEAHNLPASEPQPFSRVEKLRVKYKTISMGQDEGSPACPCATTLVVLSVTCSFSTLAK